MMEGSYLDEPVACKTTLTAPKEVMRGMKEKPTWCFAMATLKLRSCNFFLQTPATTPYAAGTATIYRIVKNYRNNGTRPRTNSYRSPMTIGAIGRARCPQRAANGVR